MAVDSDETGTDDHLVQRPGGQRSLSRSATRALEILEYFALVGRPLRAVEIAQALNFQASSTDQLLKTLVDSAYLLFDSSNKRYYPSPRLVNFGSWISSHYFGEDRIYQLLQAVHRESREIVTLSVRYGRFMQLVDCIEPLASAGSIVKGTRIPIADSIIGLAFLSQHDDRQVIRILDQISQETDKPLSPTELKAFLKRVEDARQKDYVAGTAVGGNRWALAIALPRPESGLIMVLSLAGETTVVQSREADLLHILRKNISFWLGP